MSDLENRIVSANSFNELTMAVRSDARLTRSMGSVAPQLLLSADDQRILLEVCGKTRTVSDFLLKKDLHRQVVDQGLPYARVLGAFKNWFKQDLARAVTRSLEEADAFDDLVPFLNKDDARRPANDVLIDLDLPKPLKRRLMGLITRQTLADFLREADDWYWTDDEFFLVLEVMCEWVSERMTSSDAKDVPLPLTNLRDVRAELASTGIPDLEAWPLAQLSADPLNERGGLTVAATLQYGLASEVGRRLPGFLKHLGRLRAAPAPRLEPVTGPLAEVQATAIAQREQLLGTYPHGLGAAQTNVELRFPEVTFQVRLLGAAHAVEVSAGDFSKWAARPSLTCACGAKVCLHRVVVLDGLSDLWVKQGESVAVLTQALRPAWEMVLDAVTRPTAQPKKEKRPGVLTFTVGEGHLDFHFREQGKTRLLNPTRVDPADILGRVSGADLRIAERLALADRDGESKQLGDALLLLANHPRVAWEGEELPSPTVRADAGVKIEETSTGYRLVFQVEGTVVSNTTKFFRCSTGLAFALRAGDGRILVATAQERYVRLLGASSTLGADLPREALPRLVEVLPELEATAVVELPEELRGEEREPRSAPLVRVATSGTGLELSIRVEPLSGGAVFTPGQGLSVSAAFDGRHRSFTRRAFEREVAEAQALAGQLGLDLAAGEETFSWQLDGSDRHVEALRRLSASGVPVEWKAPRVKFTAEAKLDRLRLRIERQKDWFGLEGEVTVDERRVSLAALLEAARERRRFVKLGEGDFAQLSETMLEALQPLAHLGVSGAKTQLTLGTAPLIDALAPQVEALDAAKEWQSLMERLASAKNKTYVVPRGLKATLREYQVEGFQWLSRLADWGVGACLADDMGLGKTLQALALLLSRAKKGPALVVAPSSVLHTWRAEAEKFAPSLKLTLFHEGDRSLGKLGEGDVVVVSWTLLAREAESFAKVRFATVVLDEAHAIKNAGTQRAKAAHGLQADFLVALSGTPVENHVGELWSLFKAVMPALLGSEESFRKRFGSGQKEALAALSNLVRPFVLRRSKSKVAKELPPRTDLEVVIPLSKEERALYDDVRLAAVAELGDVTGESKRFDVLAALTRLRLAACHPKLVDATWQGPASKLARLVELVKDLSTAGHRVLVFSQFTQHLALVVAALREEGIAFSYLDGQVPVAERQRRVEAFQQGAGGDVFLISLKAGGTGLTLTEADYVLHLDPWWNPAVEDQASDRAHRIGQTRPVTVYRLISEGTIEQQILSLHRDKRELVDSLLAGTDVAGKLSTTQLAELIRSS